ncbi:MAG: GDP-mannose 4,6-dehydratase [Bryobacteraceae bacterium]
MKILLTGGAGFIGSHLAERLLGEGHTLEIIDDLNDYYPPALKLANLDAIRRKGDFVFHRIDIRDTAAAAGVVAALRPDAIIHLAARAGVRPSLEQPLLYEQVNVLATIGLLEAARTHGVRKIVFASSSSIYGIANQVPFREDDANNLPISPYAATKLAGEKICFTYSHLYGLSIVCLRFFTVFGPRQRPDLAIRKFVERISRGEPIPVYGDGSAGRDYTFVADTVDGIVRALHHDTRYDVFNLGNSHPVALRDMIATIEAVTGRKAIVERQPDQPGDVPITYADIAKAQRLLGYNPSTPLRDGIEAFVAWASPSSASVFEPEPASACR